MSDAVRIALISSIGAIVLAITNGVIAAIKWRREKKADKQSANDEWRNRIEQKVDKLVDHDRLHYLALLRLTIMDSDMPMSERLIAGQEYLDEGGNGDVKKFYEALKSKVDGPHE